jgi:nucleoside-diphosphate-sugar epimerase
LIARVFSFFDSRQSDSFLIPALIKRIGESERGARLPLHGASNVRDIAAASHLADLIAELALSEATGVVNCGVGFGTTILDLARLVAAAMDRSDVEWQGLDDSRPSTLVADTSKLAGLIGPRPAYDVAGALSALAGPSPT